MAFAISGGRGVDPPLPRAWSLALVAGLFASVTQRPPHRVPGTKPSDDDYPACPVKVGKRVCGKPGQPLSPGKYRCSDGHEFSKAKR